MLEVGFEDFKCALARAPGADAGMGHIAGGMDAYVRAWVHVYA